jgi:hypothetical protein
MWIDTAGHWANATRPRADTTTGRHDHGPTRWSAPTADYRTPISFLAATAHPAATAGPPYRSPAHLLTRSPTPTRPAARRASAAGTAGRRTAGRRTTGTAGARELWQIDDVSVVILAMPALADDLFLAGVIVGRADKCVRVDAKSSVAAPWARLVRRKPAVVRMQRVRVARLALPHIIINRLEIFLQFLPRL